MSQFDTQKLYDLLNTLQPKTNYLFLNDPEQNSRFEDYWDDEIDAKYKESLNINGDMAHRNLIALITRDSETEIMERLIDAIPSASQLFGKPVTNEDIYHCRIIFINVELKAFFGIGLGRKTRVFEKGPFNADGTDLEGGISRFSEIDYSNAIDNIHESLVEAGLGLDELTNADFDEEEEVDMDMDMDMDMDVDMDMDIDIENKQESHPIETALSEAISDLNDYLNLDVDDIENDNH